MIDIDGTLKKCTKCKKEKPINEFHKAGKRRNGGIAYRGKCKDCENEERRVPTKDRKVPPKEIIIDVVYKKCQRMAYDAHSRVFAPSRAYKKRYRNLENPYEFENTKEMYMYLYNNFYDDIKTLLDNEISPSVDRIDASKGYSKDNIRIISHSKNTQLGLTNRRRKVKMITPNDEIIIFNSTVECVGYFGYDNKSSSRVAHWIRRCKGEKGDYKVPKGYHFEYIINN